MAEYYDAVSNLVSNLVHFGPAPRADQLKISGEKSQHKHNISSEILEEKS